MTASSFEVDRGGISYTFDTMMALTEQEPNTNFHFIIGGDMIDMLHRWYRIDDLMKIVTFVGVGRPGTIGETAIPDFKAPRSLKSICPQHSFATG